MMSNYMVSSCSRYSKITERTSMEKYVLESKHESYMKRLSIYYQKSDKSLLTVKPKYNKVHLRKTTASLEKIGEIASLAIII